jgi:hypothetical protein
MTKDDSCVADSRVNIPMSHMQHLNVDLECQKTFQPDAAKKLDRCCVAPRGTRNAARLLSARSVDLIEIAD